LYVATFLHSRKKLGYAGTSHKQRKKMSEFEIPHFTKEELKKIDEAYALFFGRGKPQFNRGRGLKENEKKALTNLGFMLEYDYERERFRENNQGNGRQQRDCERDIGISKYKGLFGLREETGEGRVDYRRKRSRFSASVEETKEFNQGENDMANGKEEVKEVKKEKKERKPGKKWTVEELPDVVQKQYAVLEANGIKIKNPKASLVQWSYALHKLGVAMGVPAAKPVSVSNAISEIVGIEKKERGYPKITIKNLTELGKNAKAAIKKDLKKVYKETAPKKERVPKAPCGSWQLQ
jgi:hypothetical protein